MGVRTAVAGVLIAASAGGGGCAERFEAVAEPPKPSPGAIEPTEAADPVTVVTRGEPLGTRALTAAEIETAPDFAEIELTRNDNPNRVPVHFELRRERPGKPSVLLGTFAPYPPDNVGTFLITLTEPFAAGDRLALELLVVDPERPGDVRIAFAPIRLTTR